METFILLAVLFLLFGGCGRARGRGLCGARGRGLRRREPTADREGRDRGGRSPARKSSSRVEGPARMAPDDPRRLASLKDRFVRGELTLEEYEREVDRLDLRL